MFANNGQTRIDETRGTCATFLTAIHSNSTRNIITSSSTNASLASRHFNESLYMSTGNTEIPCGKGSFANANSIVTAILVATRAAAETCIATGAASRAEVADRYNTARRSSRSEAMDANEKAQSYTNPLPPDTHRRTSGAWNQAERNETAGTT